MARIRATLIALLLVAPLTTSPAAAQVVYIGNLSGDNEVPPVASPGSGRVTILYYPVHSAINVSVTFTGLTAGSTAAHIHCCSTGPSGNAGVASPVPTLPGFPSGITAGIYNAAMAIDGAGFYNPPFLALHGGSTAAAEAALVAAMGEGRAYFNLHTSTFPGGELRANLFEQAVFANGFEGP